MTTNQRKMLSDTLKATGMKRGMIEAFIVEFEAAGHEPEPVSSQPSRLDLYRKQARS